MVPLMLKSIAFLVVNIIPLFWADFDNWPEY